MMETLPSTSEIVEFSEELDDESENNHKAGKHHVAKSGNNRYSIEEDINRLFDSIGIRTSARGFDWSGEVGRDTRMKRPLRVGGSSHSSRIGISEPVSLKQALRGLCISQASEMAAMKRLTKVAASSSVSEAGIIKMATRGLESKGNLVEISLVPERSSPKFASKRLDRVPEADTDVEEISHIVVEKLRSSEFSCRGRTGKFYDTDTSSRPEKVSKGQLHSASLPSHGRCLGNSVSYSPHFIKPVFRNKSFIKKKQDLTSASSSSSCSRSRNVSDDTCPSTSSSSHVSQSYSMKSGRTRDIKSSPLSSGTNNSSEINSSSASTSSSKRAPNLNSRSKGKTEFSQSFKSSVGENNSSTSVSEESIGFTRGGSRPHMSKDSRWEAIHRVQKQQGSLSLNQFKLLRKLGSGDIRNVYLAELTDTNYLFSLKVMDNEFLAGKNKMPRAQTEREILQLLDHPFLPTLYSHFSTDKLSCLVMEYCPGGDLHVLRQKQPGRSFYEQAARFYVAEVLLALEYLHMLGVIYRDLKPENVLVREDGHIMLTDFDLSLRCTANPVLLKSSPLAGPMENMSSPCSESSCIEPLCSNPSFQVPCFTPGRLSIATIKSRNTKPDPAMLVSPLPQIVVEPTSARSNSFVGTHEYLAPEIIKGEGHGSEVDWWTFGIFLFELLYGRTPFKGSGNEETLSNVVSQNLKFPSSPEVSFHGRDLIRGLLIKDPKNRLGSVKGAAEIKQHPFFEGVNWALIRCAVPPELPKCYDTAFRNVDSINCNESKAREEFEMF